MTQLVEEGDKKRAENKSFLYAMLKKASLFLYAVSLAAIIACVAFQLAAPQGSVGTPVSIELSRGTFTVFDFRPQRTDARAIILFGSGDGGWSGFEETISKALQNEGYEVVGINSKTYARTDYDLAILQADFGKIAQAAKTHAGSHQPPVILGGWSMGAAQAIAAAGGPHPPQGLAGLLLLDPCSRGRYGLRLSDQSDMLPTGPGTFSMTEFAQTMGNLHVVQWHAAEDSIDSRVWLDSLTAPHKEFDFAKTGHYYNNDRADFLSQMIDSVPWILSRERDEISATGSKP